MKTLLRRRRRQLLFLCVGVTCFLTQYAALTAMAAAGTYRPLANALGFAISAQLNFVLSARLTWRDRPTAAARTLWARWASYNGTALISLAVNTAVFTATYHRIGNLPAAALGVLCGMCVTYLVCDMLIFRDRGRPETASRSRHRPLHAGSAAAAPVAVAWDRPAVPPRERAAALPWERPAVPPWERAAVPPGERAAAASWDRSAAASWERPAATSWDQP
jgi:putative flippase GtrA